MIAISPNKNQIGLQHSWIQRQQFLTNWKRTARWAEKWHSNGFQGPGKGSSSPMVEFGEPGLDLLPEEAISTSTRTLLANLGVADPGDGGPLPFYIVDLENFTTASRQYTDDIHNSIDSRSSVDTICCSCDWTSCVTDTYPRHFHKYWTRSPSKRGTYGIVSLLCIAERTVPVEYFYRQQLTNEWYAFFVLLLLSTTSRCQEAETSLALATSALYLSTHVRLASQM